MLKNSASQQTCSSWHVYFVFLRDDCTNAVNIRKNTRSSNKKKVLKKLLPN